MDEVEDMRADAVRLMVSITDRGDDMSFPIIFISMLPGTHCTTSNSTLLLLLLSDIVYLWENQIINFKLL